MRSFYRDDDNMEFRVKRQALRITPRLKFIEVGLARFFCCLIVLWLIR